MLSPGRGLFRIERFGLLGYYFIYTHCPDLIATCSLTCAEIKCAAEVIQKIPISSSGSCTGSKHSQTLPNTPKHSQTVRKLSSTLSPTLLKHLPNTSPTLPKHSPDTPQTLPKLPRQLIYTCVCECSGCVSEVYGRCWGSVGKVFG